MDSANRDVLSSGKKRTSFGSHSKLNPISPASRLLGSGNRSKSAVLSTIATANTTDSLHELAQGIQHSIHKVSRSLSVGATTTSSSAAAVATVTVTSGMKQRTPRQALLSVGKAHFHGPDSDDENG